MSTVKLETFYSFRLIRLRKNLDFIRAKKKLLTLSRIKSYKETLITIITLFTPNLKEAMLNFVAFSIQIQFFSSKKIVQNTHRSVQISFYSIAML